MRCGSTVKLNELLEPISHECSHYWSRGKEGTRFEPDNCDTLCYGCHNLWGHGDERDKYKEFKIKQLGQRRFDTLQLQAFTYCKKDRTMSAIICKAMFKDLRDKLL